MVWMRGNGDPLEYCIASVVDGGRGTASAITLLGMSMCQHKIDYAVWSGLSG